MAQQQGQSRVLQDLVVAPGNRRRRHAERDQRRRGPGHLSRVESAAARHQQRGQSRQQDRGGNAGRQPLLATRQMETLRVSCRTRQLWGNWGGETGGSAMRSATAGSDQFSSAGVPIQKIAWPVERGPESQCETTAAGTGTARPSPRSAPQRRANRGAEAERSQRMPGSNLRRESRRHCRALRCRRAPVCQGEQQHQQRPQLSQDEVHRRPRRPAPRRKPPSTPPSGRGRARARSGTPPAAGTPASTRTRFAARSRSRSTPPA